MWQRNDTGHVVDVAAHPDEAHPDRRPFAVGPAEVVDFDELLAGFTEVDPPGASEQSESDAEPAAKTARKRAATAPALEGDDR